MEAYLVTYRDANSYHSVSVPKAVFLEREKAEEFAKKQPGYGFNKDWFVDPIPLNP